MQVTAPVASIAVMLSKRRPPLLLHSTERFRGPSAIRNCSGQPVSNTGLQFIYKNNYVYIYMCVCVCVCRHTSLPRVAVDIYLCVYVHLAGCVLQAAAVLGSCALRSLLLALSRPRQRPRPRPPRRCLPPLPQVAVPTAIWKSRLRSGSAHCNLEVAVEVRQCPLGS